MAKKTVLTFQFLLLFTISACKGPSDLGHPVDTPEYMPTNALPRTYSPISPLPTPLLETGPRAVQSFDDYSDITKRWLQGTTCQIHCWEGITLKKTTKSEAIDTLKQNPYVGDIKIWEDAVGWRWSDRRFGGGELTISGENEIVGGLLVDFPDEVHLRDVVNAFGEPSHIIAQKRYDRHQDDTYFLLYIVFESQGFTLDTGIYDKEPQLDGNLTFYRVVYPMYSRNELYEGDDVDVMVPWDGYLGFQFYCRDDFGEKCMP